MDAMLRFVLVFLVAIASCSAFPISGFLDDEAACKMSRKLRDKWVFVDRWTKNFIRIRSDVFIYFDKENGVKYRYVCTETRGNIYLLVSQDHPTMDNKGVLCLGFTYFGRPQYVEYAILRLNSNDDKFRLISPSLVPANETTTIDKSCDLIRNQRVRKVFAFVKRVSPGCKFPRDMRTEWQCTDMSSLKVTFNATYMTYILTNGNNVSMRCEKRDAAIFLLRISNYTTTGSDAIVCLRISPLPNDIDYSYRMLRLNSGTAFDGKLKIVKSSKQVYIHQICDWIDSPARPEYLYAFGPKS